MMQDNPNKSPISFSLRPYTFGEIELADKLTHGDVSATIDLIVSRSDPPVSRAFVEALTEPDIMTVMTELTKTISTQQHLRKLFG